MRKRGKSWGSYGSRLLHNMGAPASALQTAPWQRHPLPWVPLGWVQPAFASSLLSSSGLSRMDSPPPDGHTLQSRVILWKQPMLFNPNDKINNYSQRCLFKAYDVPGTVSSALNTLTHLIHGQGTALRLCLPAVTPGGWQHTPHGVAGRIKWVGTGLAQNKHEIYISPYYQIIIICNPFLLFFCNPLTRVGFLL